MPWPQPASNWKPEFRRIHRPAVRQGVTITMCIRLPEKAHNHMGKSTHELTETRERHRCACDSTLAHVFSPLVHLFTNNRVISPCLQQL